MTHGIPGADAKGGTDMNARLLRAAVTACGLALVGGMVASAPAAAQPFEKGRFHDVFTDFFDCDGTPTRLDGDVSGNFLGVRHGSELVYFRDSVRGTLVYTNLNTGGTFTEIFRVNNRDAQVTDNGDGTLTIVVYASGSSRFYDTDGNFVLAEPGQFRFQFMVDHGGTPGDPTDDVEIENSFEVVRESTGRNDTQGRDFCEDLVTFTS
jgi:hypothetical protein